jgi:hypothetical protein
VDVIVRHRAWTFLLVLAALSVGASYASAGQFRRPVYYRAGQRPHGVVAARFTQSGNVDLAFTDLASNQVVTLLGNGDGTFQSPRTFSASNPIGLAVGDFNEDGNLDLVVVEANGTGDGAVTIFLGDGKGGLKRSASYPIGIESVNVTVADFNGDGHLDAAVTDFGFESTPGDVIVFFGNGRGKLRRVAKFKSPQGPGGIAAGDLNGDHHPDLVVTKFGGSQLAVFMNDGRGYFKKPVPYFWNGSPVDVKIADLRHSGKQDLVVADGAEGMAVLLNNGDGTFGKPTIYVPTCQNCVTPEACVVADFNLDGHLDVACATSIDDSYLFYGNGKGNFGPSIPIHDAIKFQGGHSIAAGDFNNDKAPDLAIPIQAYGKVAIMLNTQ